MNRATHRLFCAIVVFAALSDRASLANEGPLFSVKGWGHNSNVWGETQPDPRSTRLVSTSDTTPEDDQSLAVGDINGDDCTDVAIGLPSADGTAISSVIVFYGTAQKWEKGSQSSQCLAPSPPVQYLTSDQAGFGSQLVIAELTGDEWDDLVISAPQAALSRRQQTFPLGMVSVYSGSRYGLSIEPVVVLDAGVTDERLGSGLSLAPDLTGDGLPDVWVASGHDMVSGQGEGRILLWPGNICWAPNPPQSCPQEPNVHVNADELSGLAPYFELAAPEGADLDFGSAVLAFDKQVLASDPTCNAGGNCIAYGYALASGVLETSGPVLTGHDSATSRFGQTLLSLTVEADVGILVSAPRWRNLYADVSKVGRLELYVPSAPDVWAHVSWERPEWDLQGVQEDYKALGLGSALTSLIPLDYTNEGDPRTLDAAPELATSNPGYCRSGGQTASGLHPGRVYALEADTLWQDAVQGTGQPRPLPAPFGWEGEEAGDCFGRAVAGGDFNGDGLYDLVVRASDGNAASSPAAPGTLTFLWSVSLLFDADGDGYTSYPGLAPMGESGQWSTYSDGLNRTLRGNDCDENNSAVHADALESCNGVDDDCNGTIDDNLPETQLTTFYLDADRDGYGSAETTVTACFLPDGYSTTAADCDDSSADTYPGAHEVAGDDVDEDCDQREICYKDLDFDGYRGNDEALVTSTGSTCSPERGEARAALPGGDCDDSRANVHPGAQENYGTVFSESCADDHFVGCRTPDTWQVERGPGCLSLEIHGSQTGQALPLIAVVWLRHIARKRKQPGR